MKARGWFSISGIEVNVDDFYQEDNHRIPTPILMTEELDDPDILVDVNRDAEKIDVVEIELTANQIEEDFEDVEEDFEDEQTEEEEHEEEED